MGLISDILGYLQNSIKNGVGIERNLLELIRDGDIEKAKQLFQDRDSEVLRTIEEYDVNLHKVMFRRDKPRKGKAPYIVQKLPRSWQRYINEVALFFLLAKPIIWKEINPSEETEIAFKAYEKFLEDTRFYVTMRNGKRLAGAETESAKVYHVYQDAGMPKVKVMVISKSQGYTLRPMFDQFKNMIAFGYGYFLNEGGKTVEHFDILTAEIIYRCKKSGIGWEVKTVINPIGKIPAIYYKQPKEWEGVERRIERDEEVDSKTGDTNNYFADPIAKVSVDVIKNIPKGEDTGKLVQMAGKDSVFEYVSPPTATEMKDGEKKVLRDSILMDTFTPDFTFENMKGTGTLSGVAIKRALILGYMKRDNRMEIYDELVDREKNLILAIMANVTHIYIRDAILKLNISHEFAEPFDDDTSAKWSAIGKAYTDGIISLETSVELMGVANPVEEIEKIKAEKQLREEEIVYPTI